MRKPTIIHQAVTAMSRLAFASGAAALVALAMNTAQAATTTSVINLGAQGSGTYLVDGNKVLKSAKGVLPAGSLLRSVSINARLDDGDPYDGDICVFFAETSSSNGVLRVGDNYDGGAPDADTEVIWDAGNGYFVGDTIVKTITSGIPAIDLNRYAVFLTSGWGGTWSGSITLEYDLADPNTLKDITSFSFGALGDATINGTSITKTVPHGTSVTALSPTYTLSGGACVPASDTAQNFSTPQSYTVTALDNSTKVYTVTVTVAPAPPGGVGDGLVAWLKADAVDPGDASQIRSSGSVNYVQKWVDSSGNNYHATNTNTGTSGNASYQPVYVASDANGKPAIQFIEDTGSHGDNGSVLFMGDLGANFPSAASAFIVATPNDASTGYTLFDNENNDGRWWSGPNQYNESTPGTFHGGGRDTTFNTPAVKAAWPRTGTHVFAMESSSSIYRYVVDGSNIAGIVGTPNYNSGSGNTMTVGNRWQGGGTGSQLNGTISELILFNRVLTTAEANQVGKYLADKYGVETTYFIPGTATTTTLASSSASNTSSYGESVTFTATVAPAPTGGTVQFHDNAGTLGSPVAVDSATGLAEFSTSALSVGGHTITATYSGTTGISGSTASAITQTVNKATATIATAPTASPITYGQTLASSTLSGGAGSVAGSFAFTTPTTAPGVGTAAQNVTFTPTDANYTSATTTVSVTVDMATPVYKAPVAPGVMVTLLVNARNTGISGSTVSGPGGIAANWNYPNPSLTDNWQDATGSGLVDSTGAATSVGFKLHFPSNDPWGSPALEMLKTGLYNPGYSDWGNCEISGLIAGNSYTLYVASARINSNERSKGTFRMLNTADKATADLDCSSGYGSNTGGPRNGDTWVEGNNYVAFHNVIADANGKIFFNANENCAPHLVVNGFQLVSAGVAIAESTPITYGQKLSASTLGGTFVDAAGVAVAGTLAFTHPNDVPNVGTASHGVTFTPTDTANYNIATANVNVTVTAPTDPFAAWISANYPGLSDKSAAGDPSHSGMSNQAKYAFGLDPSSGASCNPIKTPLNKSTGTFTYTRRVGTGYTYRVWTSTDLVSAWTEDAAAVQHVDSTAGDVETVTVTLSASTPLAAQKLFMRVSAE